MSQKQRDGDQPRVLTGRRVGRTADKRVEVVTDVKFFEQRFEQRTSPREATCAEAQCTQVLDTVVVSPTGEMNESLVRGRRLGVSSACGSVAHGRHLR